MPRLSWRAARRRTVNAAEAEDQVYAPLAQLLPGLDQEPELGAQLRFQQQGDAGHVEVESPPRRWSSAREPMCARPSSAAMACSLLSRVQSRTPPSRAEASK